MKCCLTGLTNGFSSLSAFMRRISVFIAISLAISSALTACVSIGDTGLLRPPAQDIASASERDQLVKLFGGPYKAKDALTDTITQITDRIAKASDEPNTRYRLTILNSPSINAFALPTGDLFVTRGLIALANDTSELGAVIAHEIAHVTAHHANRRAEIEKSIIAIPDEIGADEAAMVGEGHRFKLASFSRAQELEADEIGIKTLAKAGYDPYGASRFLLALNRTMMLDGDSATRKTSRSSFLASHPSTPQRLAVAIDTAATYLSAKSVEADRNLYLAALNGLNFGDDPNAGLIAGQKFFHAKLDFTFTAPDNFLLENSPDAVIGMPSSREQSMRLDTILSKDAAASLKLGWIEGATLGAVVPIDVSGYTAFTTTANDRDWHYRLAAIEKDGKLFRMIFAARYLTPELDATFLQSIRSFRGLTPQEFESLKPLKVMIARAESGDTIDTMAARMAGLANAQDLFRLLNGVDKREVKEGALYKIIVPK